MRLAQSTYTFYTAIICIAMALTGCSHFQPQTSAAPVKPANMIEQLEAANDAYSRHEWSVAIKHYRSLSLVLPKDEFTQFRLGNSLLRNSDFKSAAAAFEQALKLNPEFFEAKHNLVTAYLLLARQELISLQRLGKQANRNQGQSINLKGSERQLQLLKQATEVPLEFEQE